METIVDLNQIAETMLDTMLMTALNKIYQKWHVLIQPYMDGWLLHCYDKKKGTHVNTFAGPHLRTAIESAEMAIITPNTTK
jgi:hypothetical protein